MSTPLLSNTSASARLEALTIGQFFARCAQTHGDSIALHYLEDGSRLSYAQLHRETDRYAVGLQSIGVGRGCHVALMLENSAELLFLLVALGKLGAVAVPLTPTLRGDLLARFLRHADATVLVTDPARNALPPEDLLREGQLRWIVSQGDTEARLDGLGKAAPRLCRLADLRVQDRPFRSFEAGEVAYSDLAMLMYTSGTTGPSKANMFSQAHVLQYAMEQARGYGYGPSDVVYTCLPISHANGLLSSTYGAFVAGARVALAGKFSVSRFWSDVRASGATTCGLLGSMTDFLWNAPPSAQDRDHGLRRVVMIPVPPCGAAFAERFHVSILSSYGLTDYALATLYRPEDPPQKLGSAGRPRPGMQVRVVDEHDLDQPPGVLGEIVLRSDNMWATASGYYKMPAETLACMRNLWFHSGDRGYLDEDGYLYFVDRKKDAIRRRGENVSAFEVESVILGHEAVHEVAVFPVKAAQSEDEIAACVVLAPGAALTEEALAQYCARHLAQFMVPRYIRFLASLPKTHSEKVEKYKLRAMAEADPGAFWDSEHGRERPQGQSKGLAPVIT